jgi:hypothetical protein
MRFCIIEGTVTVLKIGGVIAPLSAQQSTFASLMKVKKDASSAKPIANKSAGLNKTLVSPCVNFKLPAFDLPITTL